MNYEWALKFAKQEICNGHEPATVWEHNTVKNIAATVMRAYGQFTGHAQMWPAEVLAAVPATEREHWECNHCGTRFSREDYYYCWPKCPACGTVAGENEPATSATEQVTR